MDLEIASPPSLKIITTLENQRIVSYIDVCSGFLVLYDLILRSSLEVDYIWSSKWSFLKALYIVQRYLPVADTVIALPYHTFAKFLPFEECVDSASIGANTMICGIILSEVVLCFRVRAVWGNHHGVTIALAILLVACWVPAVIFINEWISSLKYLEAPIKDFRGCFVLSASNIIYRSWVLMLLFDTATLILILVPGIRDGTYRFGGSSRISKTIYQDGVIYYVLIFVASVVNVAAALILPPELARVLASFERVLHSILTSRAVLHIRQVASQRVYVQDTPRQGDDLSIP